jgi:predicted ArsR family transcriptional regulator
VNVSNIEKGRRTRRALLAIARVCHERGRVLPRYDRLGKAVGTDDTTVSRQMERLVKEGALSLASAGRRFRVVSVRS